MRKEKDFQQIQNMPSRTFVISILVSFPQSVLGLLFSFLLFSLLGSGPVKNVEGFGTNMETRFWYSLYSGYFFAVMRSVSGVDP